MKYPLNTQFYITNIKFGDIDSLGSGNNEFKPQSGIEVSYKLFSYQLDPDTQRRKKYVVGSGTISIPTYNNEFIQFDEIETRIVESIKNNTLDLIISAEEYLIHNNVIGGAKSIFESIEKVGDNEI
jgi:hypothetical protein